MHVRKSQLAQLISSSRIGSRYANSRLTITFGDPFNTRTKNYHPHNNPNFAGLASKLCSRPMLHGRSCHAPKVVPRDADQYSVAGLRLDNVPKHVAIILDGSRRWLKAHGKPLNYGPFFEANLLFADLCIKWGVGTATTFVYSLRNLGRGKEANDLIFGQLEEFLQHNVQHFIRKQIRVKVIGERSVLPESLQNKIAQVEEATKECTKLELMLAVCYAGTRDIVKATRKISERVNNGAIEAKGIDEGVLESELSTNGSRAPHIDLLIRTGGRHRISDYLVWQLAHAELYFTNICAPEFGELVFVDALRFFQNTERTFGK